MTARRYDPTCSYPGCGRPHNSHGLCSPHGAMSRQGEPLRPLQDRTGPFQKSPATRFASKVVIRENGCWDWVGGKTLGGYGMFSADASHHSTKKDMAHRWSYENKVGPIPHGFDIDHLCRNRACVNPDHLEPVTRQENIRRASANITHCPQGHAYDEANTYLSPRASHRKCRACMHAQELARRPERNAKKRAATAARGPKPRKVQTHCRRGHPLSGDNLYVPPTGTARHCRACRAQYAIDHKE